MQLMIQTRLICICSFFLLCASVFAFPQKTPITYVNNKLGYEVLIPKNSVVENAVSIKTYFGDTINLLQNNNEEFKPNISAKNVVSIILPTITPKKLLKNDYIRKYLVILTLNDLPKCWRPEQVFSGKQAIVGKNAYYEVKSADSAMMQSVEGEHYFIKHANTYYVISFLLASSHSEVSPNFPGYNERSIFDTILATFEFNK